jgi:hypothetical protein
VRGGNHYGTLEENLGKAQIVPLVFQALERYPYSYEIVIASLCILYNMLSTEMNEWPDPLAPRTVRCACSYFQTHPDCMRIVEHAGEAAQAFHPDGYIDQEFHMLRSVLFQMGNQSKI